MRAGSDGAPEVTDGPFPESKEYLAGWWVIDVDEPGPGVRGRDRDLGGPGPRRCAAAPADRGTPSPGRAARGRVTEAVEDLLRTEAPQVLGALLRRYDDFAAAEDAVQEALIAAAEQWPRDGAAGLPARLAHPGREPQDARPPAQRAGPAASRGATRRSRSPRRSPTRTTRWCCCSCAVIPH